jgi:hypothetical protein
MSEWSRFFAIRLPVAMFAVAATIEAAAYLLSGVPLHRHNVDDLANAVIHDTHPYRVVLLGDSVTHNVAHRFRIGEAEEVADLTTHGLAGLPSSLFLLKRYLESGHRPRNVVLAASLGTLVEPMMSSTFNYYVTSVFTLPYEREFLQRCYPSYVNYRWKPAALSMTTRLGEPLFSLLRQTSDQIWTAPDLAPAAPVREIYGQDDYDEGVRERRLNDPAEIRPEVRAILTEMCALSRQYGFSLHIIWAPMQTELRKQVLASGKMQRIDEQLVVLFREAGIQASVDDSGEQQDYPYFDRALLHIKGLGWEETYANQLTAYIRRFDAPTS